MDFVYETLSTEYVLLRLDHGSEFMVQVEHVSNVRVEEDVLLLNKTLRSIRYFVRYPSHPDPLVSFSGSRGAALEIMKDHLLERFCFDEWVKMADALVESGGIYN